MAKETEEAKIAKHYPVGSDIQWKHAGQTRSGIVQAHMKDHLLVKNEVTGNEYPINVSQIKNPEDQADGP